MVLSNCKAAGGYQCCIRLLQPTKDKVTSILVQPIKEPGRLSHIQCAARQLIMFQQFLVLVHLSLAGRGLRTSYHRHLDVPESTTKKTLSIRVYVVIQALYAQVKHRPPCSNLTINPAQDDLCQRSKRDIYQCRFHCTWDCGSVSAILGQAKKNNCAWCG